MAKFTTTMLQICADLRVRVSQFDLTDLKKRKLCMGVESLEASRFPLQVKACCVLFTYAAVILRGEWEKGRVCASLSSFHSHNRSSGGR